MIFPHKRKRSSPSLLILLAAALTIALSNCGGKGVKGPPSAEEMYQKGLKWMEPRGLFHTRNYPLAMETFEKLIEEYPFSDQAILAQLKIGDIHFERKEYPEAIQTYQDFLRLHPRSESRRYLIYRIGTAYYKQIGTIDRDQNDTIQAEKYFKQFLQEYPNSDEATDVQEKLRFCENHLIEREIYVGKFYYRRKEYESSWNRFKTVLAKVRDHSSQRAEALYYGGLTLKKLGESEKAEKLFEELISDFPGSRLSRRAKGEMASF